MCDTPVANSTRKIVSLKRRPSIRTVRTSIIKDFNSDNEINSENEIDSEFQPECVFLKSDYEDNIKKIIGNSVKKTGKEEQNSYKHFVSLGVIISLICLGIVLFKPKQISIQNNIDNLAQKYASQEEDFWLSLQILVSDSIKYNQPKCLIVLYNDSTATIIEDLMKDLSNYAVCKFTSCDSNPVIIEAHQFEEKKYPFDYGNIITQNKDKLIASGVMVVKNMETISGQSAMAFQSFCDEYQPVVSRALILFTLKMDQHPEDKNKYVESVMRKKWSDLDDDLFFPLMVRISNFIFVVQKQP